jgi:hypothetical protein
MKILSKYKDYYDYLQGIRGMDEKVILDRSEGKSVKEEFPKDGDRHVFIICGERYEIFYYNGKYFTNDQLKSQGKQAIGVPQYGYKIQEYIPEIGKKKKWYSKWDFSEMRKEDYSHIKCPIVKVTGRYSYNTDYIEFPKLDDFNFASIISPEEMWNLLYNWQSQVPEHESNQTNSDKIVSHGFDLRESFRPKIK